MFQVDSQLVIKLEQVKGGRDMESKVVRLFDRVPERIFIFKRDTTYWVEGWYEGYKEVHIITKGQFQNLMKETPFHYITGNARPLFLINQFLLATGIYSWSFPVFLDAQNETAIAAGSLIIPTWMTLTYFLSSRERVTDGAAYGSLVGGVLGAVYGGMIFDDARAIFPSSALLNTGNYFVGQRYNLPSAPFQRQLNHALYGYYQYYTVTALLNIDTGKDPRTHRSLSSLLSLVEGYGALYLSRNDMHLTHGDALFELRAASIGAEALPLILLTADNLRGESSSSRLYAASSLVGYAAGYYTGLLLSRRYDLSTGAAIATYLAPYMANALLMGIGALVGGEAYFKVYPTLFLITDASLTYLTYRTFARREISLSFLEEHHLSVSFNPLLPVMKGKAETPVLQVSFDF